MEMEASSSALSSERPAVVEASVSITYVTKQSETTRDIIYKGPVCRQQAEVGHLFLSVAKARKLSKVLCLFLGLRVHIYHFNQS